MKKLKLLLLFLLMAAFVPLAAASAETRTPSNITVKSIKLSNVGGNAKELSQATADGQTINLGIKLSNPGDFAKYTLTINNASDKDLSLDEKSLNHSTNYMSYEFAYDTESGIIKAGEDATITLKALYQNQVPTDKFADNIFNDTNELTLNFNSISETPQSVPETPQNPITGDNILIYLFIFSAIIAFAYLVFKKKINSRYIVIAIGIVTVVAPIGAHALNTNSITATVTISIEQPQNNITPPNEAKEAYFLPGLQVNAKMKRLAGTNISDNEEPTANEIIAATDSNIVAIQHSENEPASTNKEAKNIVSTEESPLPIYMWYNNGTIYWWSEDGTPNLHQDSRYIFNGAKSLTSIDGLKDWNTSNATSISYMFDGAESLTSLDALKNWDTSNVTGMFSVFENAKSLTSLDGLKNWNTSNVTSMSSMFRGAENLTSLDALKDWDTSNVTNMANMFFSIESLTSLDGLKNWNTSKVTTMSFMFTDAESLTSLDALKDWDTSNVTGMTTMFSGTRSLTSLDALKNWDTSNVTSMSQMFSDANSLISIDGLKNWDTSNVKSMDSMFHGADKLTSLDALKDWDTSKVTDMSYMFYYAPNLTSLDALKDWDTSKVTDMSYMFYIATSLTSLNGLKNWNTSSVTNMSYMFHYAKSLTSLDGLEGWNTSKVTDMSHMFWSNQSLNDASAINDWDISNVESGKFKDMFSNTPTHPDFTKVQGTWSDGTFIPNQN